MPTISHGFEPRSPEIDIRLLPERVRSEKTAARHRLVDEHHLRLSGAITVVEAATGDQIGAHGRQEITADDAGVWLLGR